MKKKIPKWLWAKKYFDLGFGITGYLKYALAASGLVLNELSSVIWIGLAYAAFCFILGWAWIKFKIIDAENEIGNILNPFQREVREKLRSRKV